MICVRPPTSEELEAMLGLMCEAFHLPHAPARELFYRDPYFSLENKRVLVQDGRVVSCLTLVDATMWIGQARVRVAGVANVCTAEAERRKGYARRLLSDTVVDLRRRGSSMAGLLPYSYAFYQRLGWELCSTQYRFTAPPAALPPYQEARFVRPAQPEDVQRISSLYAWYSEGRTGWCVRDAKRWEYLMSYVKNGAVYSHGAAKGYMLYDVLRAEGRPSTLKVLEMVADAEEGYKGLIGFLRGYAGEVERVEYPAQWDQLEQTGLAAVVPDADLGHSVRIEIVPGMMLRVVNLAGVLEALAPNFRGWRGEVALASGDPVQGEEIVALKGSSEGIMVEPCSHPPKGMPLITGSAQAWAQVLSGYLSLDDALSLHRISVAAGRIGDAVRGRFPRRYPFLPLPDHF
ncbi:MAG: GNAT family N-acetyltransferase [Chthonomonadales bacterium]